MANPVTTIPAYTQYSININGLITRARRYDKVKWIRRELAIARKADIVHIQETHFRTKKQMHEALNQLGGKLVGAALSPDQASKGVVSWIPRKSPLYDITDTVFTSRDGRLAIIKIVTSEETHTICNVYAPSDSPQSRESFFENLSNLPLLSEAENLIMVGDWNFISDKIDSLTTSGPKQPSHPHPAAHLFLNRLHLTDVFRHRHPDTAMFTHRAAADGSRRRLDRFYIQPELLDTVGSLPTVHPGSHADHNAIGLKYGSDPLIIDPKNPVYRMSRSLIHQLSIEGSKVRTTTEDTINWAARKLREGYDRGIDKSPIYVFDALITKLRSYYRDLDYIYTRRKRLRRKQFERITELDHDSDDVDYSDLLEQKLAAETALKEEQELHERAATQSAQFNWLKDSERSSKLFFQATKARHKHNRIPNLLGPDGRTASDHNENLEVAKNSYATTFERRTPVPADLAKVRSALREQEIHLSSESIDRITKFLDLQSLEPDPEEVHSPDWLADTLENLQMGKAPGSDGIPNEFYYILRGNKDLLFVLRETYKTAIKYNTLPKTMSEVYYRLLFKKNPYSMAALEAGELDDHPANPRLLTNWRPIALIPCSAKILSAYIAENLKHTAAEVVSPTQSAFVPGRSIHDNIMLVNQMIHEHNTFDKPAGLLFIDFAHAYDYISHEYIFAVLEEMKFPKVFIDTVRMMLTNQTGRVIINQDLTDPFDINNGGKQGDPLFPLIYVIAIEGLTALLNNHPDYQGVPTPDPNVCIKHLGYADDTCIGIGREEDCGMIEDILRTFERASGNEIKKPKSYIIWLGGGFPNTDSVYGINRLESDSVERYLGVLIGDKFNPKLNWEKAIEKLAANPTHWLTMNISIFGRVLLINSCLLSKIWHLAYHTPATREIINRINSVVDRYFRKDKRSNSVNKHKRITPKHLGGLGQIDTSTQINNIITKWVIKEMAGDEHPWVIYWRNTIRRLQDELDKPTHPTLWDINWNNKLNSKRIFPMFMKAYAAWANTNLPAADYTFEEAIAQPVLNNKYFTAQRSELLPSPAFNRALATLPPAAQVLRTEHLCKERTPPPRAEYDPADNTTFRFDLATRREASANLGADIPETDWNRAMAAIDEKILEVIRRGPRPPVGWAARELESEDPDSLESVGDIYFITANGDALFYFERDSDEDRALSYVSNSISGAQSEDGWDGWQLWRSDLRPLRVSCASGTPMLLGWRDKTHGVDMFSAPGMKGRPLELTLCPSTSPSRFTPKFPIKPNFNTLFKAIRQAPFSQLPALTPWLPTEFEKEAHRRGPNPLAPCKVNWRTRLTKLHNCEFMLPKYKQLIYWITTDSLMAGKRIAHFSDRATCPHCDTGVTTPKHIFAECQVAAAVWEAVDNIGSAHWPNQYNKFDFNETPTLLREYIPCNLLKVGVLWSIWVKWCEYMFNDDTNALDPLGWTTTILNKSKEELTRRLFEAKPITQWLALTGNIPPPDPEDGQAPEYNHNSHKLPQKEILLTLPKKVKTNSDDFLFPNPGNTLIKSWIGSEYILGIDYINTKPKLKLKHEVWQTHLPPAIPPEPPPSVEWGSLRPAYFAG